MSRRRSFKPLMAVLVVGGAALAGPVSGAAASAKGIKTALKSFNGKILVAEGHVVSAIGTYKTTKDPAPVVAAIDQSAKVIGELRSAVERQSASTLKVKQAKHLIIAGLSAVITSYDKLKAAIADKGVNESVAQAEAKKAIEAVAHGRTELKKGVKELG